MAILSILINLLPFYLTLMSRRMWRWNCMVSCTRSQSGQLLLFKAHAQILKYCTTLLQWACLNLSMCIRTCLMCNKMVKFRLPTSLSVFARGVS